MLSLKTVLRSNGLYSIVTGAIALVFGGALGETMGVNPWLVRIVGIGVVVFGVTMLVEFRETVDIAMARSVVFADAAWVIGAVVVIAAPLMTSQGNLILGLVSIPVAVFAILQYLAIRAESAARDMAPAG